MGSLEDRRAALGSVPALAHLSPEALDRLAQAVREETFVAGAELVHEKDTTRDTYLMLEGRTEILEGDSKLAESGPGDVDGEIAMLYWTPRSGTIRALTDIRVLVLSASEFDRMAQTDPKVATAVRGAIEFYMRTRFAAQQKHAGS